MCAVGNNYRPETIKMSSGVHNWNSGDGGGEMLI